VLLLSAIAFTILVRVIIACQPGESILVGAIGNDLKGKISLVMYVLAIPLTAVDVRVSLIIFTLVALMWFVPDRRIESRLVASEH
jgi:hypothetical protein